MAIHHTQMSEVGFLNSRTITIVVIYVNDLPDSVKGTANMFDDDAKLYSTISILADCNAFQYGLSKLEVW